jgi:hypothetical protein
MAARMAEVGRRFRKLAPRDAKKVDKDDRTQESDKRRGTSGTTPTQRRRDDAVERKRKEAEARQTAMGKRKHGETPTPTWA